MQAVAPSMNISLSGEETYLTSGGSNGRRDSEDDGGDISEDWQELKRRKRRKWK